MIEAIWSFLADSGNRDVLSWLGGGLIVVCGGLWTMFVFFANRSGRESSVGAGSATFSNGLSGWPLVALVGVLAGAAVLVAAFSGSTNVSATKGGVAIGGDVTNSTVGSD